MMQNDEFGPAISRMAAEIERLEDEASELKRTVNRLCGFAGRDAMYHDVDRREAADLSSLRRDQFFGVPLARAVRQYLEMRGDPKRGGLGATSVNDIHAALLQGGFDFQTKNDENAKRGLRVSLSKNTAAFTRVPGTGEAVYGLREWYPNVKDPKHVPSDFGEADDASAEEEEPESNDSNPPTQDENN